MTNYRLNQWGGIEEIPPEADINHGGLAPGQPSREFAQQAGLPIGVAETAHAPAPRPVRLLADGTPDPEQEIPIALKAWLMLVKALNHTQARCQRLEAQLNLPPLPPT